MTKQWTNDRFSGPTSGSALVKAPIAPRKKIVGRFGLAVRREAGKQKGLGSIPLRLSLLCKQVVVCGYCLARLCPSLFMKH